MQADGTERWAVLGTRQRAADGDYGPGEDALSAVWLWNRFVPGVPANELELAVSQAAALSGMAAGSAPEVPCPPWPMRGGRSRSSWYVINFSCLLLNVCTASHG